MAVWPLHINKIIQELSSTLYVSGKIVQNVLLHANMNETDNVEICAFLCIFPQICQVDDTPKNGLAGPEGETAQGENTFSPPLSGRFFRSIIFVREAAMSIANRVGLTRVDEFSSPFGHY